MTKVSAVRSLRYLEACAVVVAIGLLCLVLTPIVQQRYIQAQDKADCAACARNLRNIVNAAQMYADERRFYPWSKPIVPGGQQPELQAEEDVLACLALLYKYNYVDDPRVFVCPCSDETPAAKIDDPETRMKTFKLESKNCSYTWRKRITTVNDDSRTPISGDKHSPNGASDHASGRNVAYKGGNVRFLEDSKLGDPANKEVKRARAELVGYSQLAADEGKEPAPAPPTAGPAGGEKPASPPPGEKATAATRGPSEWTGTPADLKGAVRVIAIQAAQEEFKSKNGIYAKDLAVLALHGLVRKEIVSGVFEGVKYGMESDEKSFAVSTQPTTSAIGHQKFTAKNGTKVTSVAADGSEGAAVDLKVAGGEIKANGEWQSLGVAANEGEAVHVYAEGEWKIGPTWKPHGWWGSDEKSSFGDYRLLGGDAKVGCLLAKVEGGKVVQAAKSGRETLAFIVEKPGTIHFRINDKDAQNNAGALSLFVVVVPAANAGTCMSDDEKHMLYQAAAMSGDVAMVMGVNKMIGIMKDDGMPTDLMQKFTTEHGAWAQRNVSFIQSMNSPDKAKEYVQKHLW